MPLAHNAIQRYTELQRAAKIQLGLDSADTGLERMGETLQLVRNLWELPEDGWLRGDLKAVGMLAVTAGGAGNIPYASLQIESRKWMAVVERVTIWSATAGVITARLIGVTTIANLGTTKQYRDTRATTRVPVAKLRYKNGDALEYGSPIMDFRIAANTPIEWRPNIVLFADLPYYALGFRGAANTDLNVSWEWRERVTLPGELGR